LNPAYFQERSDPHAVNSGMVQRYGGRDMNKSVVAILASLVLAACAGRDVKDSGAPVEERKPDTGATVTTPPPPPPPKADAPTATPLTPKPPLAANPLTAPGSILAQRSIFYDYDSFVVKDEFKPMVTAHAKFLTENRARSIVIQGNTDERGSREYNLALGQRRADGVKRMMMLLGVGEGQIEAVSFGEEKPRATAQEEAAYAENRRCDIVYDGEQR